MTKRSPSQEALAFYTPIFTSERVLSYCTLTRMRFGSGLLFVLSTLGSISHPYHKLLGADTLSGLTLLMGSSYVSLSCLTWYYRWYRHRGLDSIIGSHRTPAPGLTYDAAKALVAQPSDMTVSFLQSNLGRHISTRAGISSEQVAVFVTNRHQPLSLDTFSLASTSPTTLIDVVEHLLHFDHELNAWLQTTGITPDDIRGAARLIVEYHRNAKRQQRWWSRDALSRHTPLGQELAFGVWHDSTSYTKPLRRQLPVALPPALFSNDCQAIEAILAQRRGSNVIVFSADPEVSSDVLSAVEARLRHARGLNALVGQHLRLIDTAGLSAHADASTLGATLEILCHAAAKAGNTTLVVPDALTFIRTTTEQGVATLDLLEPYLKNPRLHFIFQATPAERGQLLTLLGPLGNRFLEHLIDTNHATDLLNYIAHVALTLEAEYPVTFTYRAITTAERACHAYLTPAHSYERIALFLHDVAAATGKGTIDQATVEVAVEQETGIPMALPDHDERALLLTLEETLRTLIVGQPQATKSIAAAIRRARTNLTAPDKPLASFLFLGPTGVGKTETAKALAATYFGNETAMSRFDMSEYATAASIETLIGSYEVAGRLTNSLQASPHQIILLDEFEKAHSTVKNIFLQLLDEGHVTSGAGETINGKHAIFVATSNAGSELIMRTKAQRAVTPLQHEVIDHIVTHGHFTRELLNRFDDIIIFEPLSHQEEIAIAHQILHALTKRIEEKGYRLAVAPLVLEALVTGAHSDSFGARALRHTIERTLEDYIATTIIRGEVKPGDTITITHLP